jgi:protease-4
MKTKIAKTEMGKERGKEKKEEETEAPARQVMMIRRSSVDGGKIILYLIALLVLALILFNFLLPSLGVGGCIAVIPLEGEISTTPGYGLTSSEEFVELLKEADVRPDVKGILIEINSPGGSVVASREIYSALKKVNKTTAAYISETGASGGYFVAVGTEHIFADPASITGSIGAVATLFDISRLLNNTGVEVTTFKSGELKDIGGMFRAPSEKEKEIIDEIVNEIFIDFKDTVIKERSNHERFDSSKFEGILDARILTGKQAYALGLVDELGTREEARAYLGEKVGLGRNPSICKIEKKKDFFSSLVESMGRGIGEALAEKIDLTGGTNSLKIK